MSIQNATIKAAPTSFTVTGGTDLAYTANKIRPNGLDLEVASDVETRKRRMRVDNTAAQRNPKSSGGWTPSKRAIKLEIPTAVTYDDGTTGYETQTILISSFAHPSISDANKEANLALGAQVLFDADFLTFWKTGSLV